jgi:hypothetical protein
MNIITMDEVETEEVRWLWYPYIPYGKITIVQEDKGDEYGKVKAGEVESDRAAFWVSQRP